MCAKYEKSKKGLFQSKDPENQGEERENSKNLVDDKKRSSETFAGKMGIFQKKRHLGRRKFFPSPQTRRQVSTTVLTA